jgi:hypothetical protein
MIRSSKKTLDKRKRENEVLHTAIQQSQARDMRHPINGACILCLDNVLLPNGDFGDGYIQEYNHCIPRSRLPGESNWKYLHSPENLCGSCRKHHHAFDRRPEIWLPIMAKYHKYVYDRPPFAVYMPEKEETVE